MSGYNYDMVREPSPGSRYGFLGLILIVGATAIGFALTLRSSIPVGAPRSALAGIQAPKIVAQGWLNGAAPTGSDLAGKVLVIDAWAFWCGPCRMVIPELIKLEKKYRDRGVVFIGLTSEGQATLKQSQEFIDETGIPWPNGYGAGETLDKLQIEGIPAVTIVDRDGLIVNIVVGAGDSHRDIEKAIVMALEKKQP